MWQISPVSTLVDPPQNTLRHHSTMATTTAMTTTATAAASSRPVPPLPSPQLEPTCEALNTAASSCPICDRVGSGRVASGRVGSRRVGSGRVGLGRVGSGRGDHSRHMDGFLVEMGVVALRPCPLAAGIFPCGCATVFLLLMSFAS